MSRRKYKGVGTLLALTALIAVLFGMTVYAEPVLNPDDLPGKITVSVKYGEEFLTDGAVSIYQVGEANEDLSGYIPTDAFADGDFDFSDLENADLNQLIIALEAYIVNNDIAPNATVEIGENGKATFNNVNMGLYLVIQSTPSEGYEPFDSFLVTMPYIDEVEDEYVYDVTSEQKTTLEREPETQPETQPEETKPSETTPHHSSGGGGGGGSSGGGGGSGSGGPGSGGSGDGDSGGTVWDLLPLPQTGQGWAMLIAVCAMIIAGIGLIVAHVVGRKE